MQHLSRIGTIFYDSNQYKSENPDIRESFIKDLDILEKMEQEKTASNRTLEDLATYMSKNPSLKPVNVEGTNYHYQWPVMMQRPFSIVLSELATPKEFVKEEYGRLNYAGYEILGETSGVICYDTDNPLTIDENGKKIIDSLRRKFSSLYLTPVGEIRLTEMSGSLNLQLERDDDENSTEDFKKAIDDITKNPFENNKESQVLEDEFKKAVEDLGNEGILTHDA